VFVRFLKLIGTAVPDGLELHLICDNYAPQDPGDQEVAAAPSPVPPAVPAVRLPARFPAGPAG
jgi:hypothetical protein